MRNCTCRQCGLKFLEDDFIPAVHYSEPATICWRCDVYNKAPVWAWIQAADGDYYQKQENEDG